MVRALTILAILATLAGCATTSLITSTDNATMEQQRAALCSDAQFALALADVMMAEVDTDAAGDYWTAYRAGAALALKTYCLTE